ncbi:hypothetical protein CRUP_035097 [Coryphaenoides rupestris]|nr:hypothetical protein CRUP_035097 [Coryphaenoides rupestris]
MTANAVATVKGRGGGVERGPPRSCDHPGVALQQEVGEQEVLKAEVASGEAKKARQESVSSESESDEEAEYQPNLPSPISHTLIPEEREEELEKEKEEEEEQKPEEVEKQCVEPAPITKEATPLLVEASQPTEAVEEKEMENGTEGKKVETQDRTDDPMVTPDEVPNGHALPEEVGGSAADAVSAPAAPAEEEEEAKVNGESSLTDAEPRPQVICCSEASVSAEVSAGDNNSLPETKESGKEVGEQEVLKAEVASGEAKKARQESVSSESESDEEAEYQPNLPSPISHTLIPEEREEELEKEGGGGGAKARGGGEAVC